VSTSAAASMIETRSPEEIKATFNNRLWAEIKELASVGFRDNQITSYKRII